MIKKCIALITVICFLFTSVPAPAAQASIDTPPAQTVQPGKPLLPSSIGRVTAVNALGGDTVVVAIQDLHCHAEVQEKIAAIIGALDERCRLDAVYVEGAAGALDTSWLAGVENRSLRKNVADTLVRQGVLTGAEYYSVLHDKTRLLRGIEDEKIYRENCVRLGALLERNGSVESVLRKLRKNLAFLQKKYLSDENRRFSARIRKYRAGKIPPEKYYALLREYAHKIDDSAARRRVALPVRMEDYPNIGACLEAGKIGRRVRSRAVAGQTGGLVRELKARVPFREWNECCASSSAADDPDGWYVRLGQLASRYVPDAGRRYPDLTRYIAYLTLAQRINPVQLIAEERALVERIRFALSRDTTEIEITFLSDFFSCFEDFLTARLSAADYDWCAARLDLFRQTWRKYAYIDHLDELGGDIALREDYYRANDARTRIFLNYVLQDVRPQTGASSRTPDAPSSVLDSARRVIVVVTGGFHTEGLERALSEKGISSIVVTPAVTTDTAAAKALYDARARELARRFSSSALQLWLESGNNAHLRAFARALIAGYPVEDILRLAPQAGITVTRSAGNTLTFSGQARDGTPVTETFPLSGSDEGAAVPRSILDAMESPAREALERAVTTARDLCSLPVYGVHMGGVVRDARCAAACRYGTGRRRLRPG